MNMNTTKILLSCGSSNTVAKRIEAVMVSPGLHMLSLFMDFYFSNCSFYLSSMLFGIQIQTTALQHSSKSAIHQAKPFII